MTWLALAARAWIAPLALLALIVAATVADVDSDWLAGALVGALLVMPAASVVAAAPGKRVWTALCAYPAYGLCVFVLSTGLAGALVAYVIAWILTLPLAAWLVSTKSAPAGWTAAAASLALLVGAVASWQTYGRLSGLEPASRQRATLAWHGVHCDVASARPDGEGGMAISCHDGRHYVLFCRESCSRAPKMMSNAFAAVNYAYIEWPR